MLIPSVMAFSFSTFMGDVRGALDAIGNSPEFVSLILFSLFFGWVYRAAFKKWKAFGGGEKLSTSIAVVLGLMSSIGITMFFRSKQWYPFIQGGWIFFIFFVAICSYLVYNMFKTKDKTKPGTKILVVSFIYLATWWLLNWAVGASTFDSFINNLGDLGSLLEIVNGLAWAYIGLYLIMFVPAQFVNVLRSGPLIFEGYTKDQIKSMKEETDSITEAMKNRKLGRSGRKQVRSDHNANKKLIAREGALMKKITGLRNQTNATINWLRNRVVFKDRKEMLLQLGRAGFGQKWGKLWPLIRTRMTLINEHKDVLAELPGFFDATADVATETDKAELQLISKSLKDQMVDLSSATSKARVKGLSTAISGFEKNIEKIKENSPPTASQWSALKRGLTMMDREFTEAYRLAVQGIKKSIDIRSKL